jgi:hypothetical protein
MVPLPSATFFPSISNTIDKTAKERLCEEGKEETAALRNIREKRIGKKRSKETGRGCVRVGRENARSKARRHKRTQRDAR